MKTFETYLTNPNIYVKSSFDKNTKLLTSIVYPYKTIDPKTQLVSIDLAKGKKIRELEGSLKKLEEFHKTSLNLF